MPDYLLSINNHVLLCYFISKNPVSKSKGDKEMKSKKYGMMLAVLAAAGGVSASAAPLPVYELKGLTVTATRQAETTKDGAAFALGDESFTMKPEYAGY